MKAVEAGDLSLVSSCQAVPQRGADVCFFTEGDEVFQAWRLIIPYGDDRILGGDVDVYFKGIHKQYPIRSFVIEIPWKDFFNELRWSAPMDGEALAHVKLRFLNKEDIEEVVQFRGIAKLVVTKKGYARLRIDSGFVAWKKTCEIGYSTAGRSYVTCE